MLQKLKQTLLFSGLLCWLFAPKANAQQLLIEHQLFAPGTYAPGQALEMADMDGDGDLDLFTKDHASSSALIYLNQQGIMDSLPQVIESDIILRTYSLTDWNADGLPDLLIDNYSAPKIYIRYNLGGLNFGPAQLLLDGSDFIYLYQKDLNNDGFVDLYNLYSSVNNPTLILVFENNGGLPSATPIQRNWQTGTTVGFGDLDGDGKLEQIISNAIGGFYTELLILRDTGNYDFVIDQTINIVDFSYGLIQVVDLDKDGRSEIIYVSADVSWRIIRQTTLGQYVDTPIGISGFANSPSELFSIYDFDGNGFEDLHIGTDLYLNDQFNFTKIALQDAPAVSARFGDTNADGILEAWWAGLSIRSKDYLGNGQYSATKVFVQAWTVLGSSTAMDVENDGDIDFLFISAFEYLVLSRNNNGNYTESVLYGFPIYPNFMIQFDYNGDGFMDFLAGRLIFPNEIGWQDMDSLPGVTLQGKEIHWPLNQLPTLTTQGLWVDFLMPNFQNIGDTLRFVAEITLNDGANAITQRDTLTTILTCAYDPNDKLIANIERFYVGDEHYTLTAPELVEYVVRFQNTGNDTANQVVILDNLSSVFDYSSFEFLSSSHPCRTNLDFTGLLRVEFPNIALPDSSNDVKGSMGYLKFAVSLKPNPPRNEPIRNIARILFDQNPAILTNIAVFRIVDCAYFGAGITLDDLQCEGDKYEIFVPTHGLEQTYQWTFNNQIISEADTATYYLTQLDNTIGLKINNELCQLDTSFYFHSNGGYPDLQLSLDSSAAFCFGSPIEITSNMITEWYRNDTLAAIGYSYLATITQTLTAATSPLGQPCVAKKSIQLTAVPIANPLILEGEPNIFITR